MSPPTARNALIRGRARPLQMARLNCPSFGPTFVTFHVLL